MDYPLLRDLGFILIAAAAVVLAARAVRVPAILAYMVTGLVLGPATHLLHPSGTLELISKVGIALLLFLVGLELSLDKIRTVGRVAVVAGVGQIALTLGLGWGLALALGFTGTSAVLVALAMTFSSTVVVIKLLEERDALDAVYGRIAVGVLLIQDVAVVIALTLLAGLEDSGAVGLASVGRGVAEAGAGMAALLVVAYLATRWLLPPLFRWLSSSLEAVFVWSLTWAFAFILAAQLLGLSIEIGAFIAGISLAQLPYSHELVRRVHPLVSFFLAVFFVTLGAHMELAAALAVWPAVLALSAFVLLGKPAILMALIPRVGYGERTSFLASLTLGQISEFSFIVASLALSVGLVDASFISVVGAVGLVTIGTSAVLVQAGDGVYATVRRTGLLRLFRPPASPEPAPEPGLSGHVIVVGMNTLGKRLVRELTERGETVLAVDVDAAKLEAVRAEPGDVPGRLETLQGNTDHPEVLEHAGLERAKLLVSALQIQDANNLMAYRARQAGVPSAIHAFDARLAHELEDHGATYLMVSKYDGIRQMTAALRDAGVIQ
jgi:Kef-type K+ transport system membrane component KefB